PAPLVRTARALPVIRHTAAEGEETQKLLIFDEFLVRQQQRLALPEEPQILPQARLIQIAPELVRDRARISEWREKRNGRRAHPVLAHPSIFAAKRLVFVPKSKRWVGSIENHHIDSGIGQHAGVLPDSEGIRQDVLTHL